MQNRENGRVLELGCYSPVSVVVYDAENFGENDVGRLSLPPRMVILAPGGKTVGLHEIWNEESENLATLHFPELIFVLFYVPKIAAYPLSQNGKWIISQEKKCHENSLVIQKRWE